MSLVQSYMCTSPPTTDTLVPLVAINVCTNTVVGVHLWYISVVNISTYLRYSPVSLSTLTTDAVLRYVDEALPNFLHFIHETFFLRPLHQREDGGPETQVGDEGEDVCQEAAGRVAETIQRSAHRRSFSAALIADDFLHVGGAGVTGPMVGDDVPHVDVNDPFLNAVLVDGGDVGWATPACSPDALKLPL